MSYICLLTDDRLEAMGSLLGAPECANCTDASWWYRGEAPILNAQGVKFCSVECADEYDTRVEGEKTRRESDWCSSCGFDNHEHNVGCVKVPAGRLTYGPPRPR